MKAGVVQRMKRLEQAFKARTAAIERPPMIVTSRDGFDFVSAVTDSGEMRWSARETKETEMPVPLLNLLGRWAPDLAEKYARHRAALKSHAK